MPGGRLPFTRLQRQVLIENDWHLYCRDRYVQSDGSDGVYYYVDMPGSCGVVPIFEDGSTALLRVRRYLLDADFWEFPIGGMRAGEEPLAVAKKELREEAGLLANDWVPIGRFAPYKGVSNEVCHYFVARDLSWAGQDLEASESISVHRMPLQEARDKLVHQDLSDGQSLSGLILLDRWLGGGGSS